MTLTRKTPLRRGKPLKKRSRHANGVQYRLAKCKKAMFEKYGVRCVLEFSQRCSTTIDMMHILPVGSHPHLKFEPLNHLPGCRACHCIVHKWLRFSKRMMLSRLTPSDRTELERLAAQPR